MLTTGIRSEVGVKVFGNDLEGARGAGPGGGGGAAEDPGRGGRVPRAGDGRAVPRHPGEPRGGGALRHHGGRDPGRDRDRGRRDQPDADHRGAPALPRAGPLRAPVPRERPRRWAACSSPPRTAPRCRWASSRTIRQVAGPSMISSENGLLVVTVLLNVRGRDVGSFVEEARRIVAERVAAAAGLVHRVERAVRERGAGPAAAADRDPGRPRRDLHAAVRDLPLVPRRGAGAARGAVRPRRAGSICYTARLQLLGRRLGRVHRAVRHRGADRRW